MVYNSVDITVVQEKYNILLFQKLTIRLSHI